MKNGTLADKKTSLFKFILTNALILLFVSACGIFKGNKEIERLKFSYSSTAEINYGHSFSLKTMLVYKNGREKDISGKKDLTIVVKRGDYKNGKIKIGAYPQSLQPDTIHVKAVYTANDKTYEYSEAIPFNYQGALLIDFSGEPGADGADGGNKGTPLLLRNGKTGGAGLIGAKGNNGHDLTINIWKEKQGERYRISVANLVTNKTYQYTYVDKGFGIQFDVRGGKGGTGGDGGDGGDGKDGVVSDKKTKNPGDGGDGGIGGNGGNGGDSGMVYVFVHPTAEVLIGQIAVYNFGGKGGSFGKGGKAGQGGDPAAGQYQVPDGVMGSEGIAGESGVQGPQFEIVVEDFDIEN